MGEKIIDTLHYEQADTQTERWTDPDTRDILYSTRLSGCEFQEISISEDCPRFIWDTTYFGDSEKFPLPS